MDLSEIFKEKELWDTLHLRHFFKTVLAKNLEKTTLNYKEPIIVEHLAFLSVKYNIYLSELYQALVAARVTGKSICEELKIDYRGTKNDHAVFLITKDQVVVVQFKVSEEFLLRKNISFESWLDTDKVRRQISKQNIAINLTSIQNLRVGMKKVNLNAEVLEIQEPQLVNTQFGSRVKVTGIWLTDETGKIKLCFWGERATLPVVGEILQIKGASVKTFKGERLLSLGRTGTLSILRPLLVE